MNIIDRLKKQALTETGSISEKDAHNYRSDLTLSAARDFGSKLDNALTTIEALNDLLKAPKVYGSFKTTLKTKPYEAFDGKRIEVIFCRETQKPLCASLIDGDI